MARVIFLMACPSGADPGRFAPFADPGNSQYGERSSLGKVFGLQVNPRLGDLDGKSRVEDRLPLTDPCALT
jgi:hypothetical protein